MKALVYANDQLFLDRNFPAPVLGQQEALIRVHLAGICTTDLEIIKGYMGFSGIPGHEFVGTVEKADDANLIGKRVVGSINAGCGICDVCRGHGPEHCPDRSVLGIFNRHGAFGQYLTLPTKNLFEIPASVKDEEAIFTEPLAAALRICQQLPINPEADIAVLGPGRLGLLIGQVLKQTGASPLMVGRNDQSIQTAKTLGLNGKLLENLPDNVFDLVVDATGTPEGFSLAMRLTKPLGTIILKSTFAARSGLDMSQLVIKEISLIGSRCGPFAPALRLLGNQAIQTTPLLEARYPLEDGVEAFAHAARPGAKKVLLQIP